MSEFFEPDDASFLNPLAILEDMPLEVQAILDAMPLGYYEGRFAKQLAFMPFIAPNFISWCYRFHYLGERLYERGYIKYEDQNQPRLIGPSVRGICPTFIILTADFEGEFIKVSRKGPVTQRFVDGNAAWQLPLPFEEYKNNIPTEVNIVLVNRLETNNILVTYAVVPIGNIDNQTRIRVFDLMRLGEQDMNLYEKPSSKSQQAESVINPVLLPENLENTIQIEDIGDDQADTGTNG